MGMSKEIPPRRLEVGGISSRCEARNVLKERTLCSTRSGDRCRHRYLCESGRCIILPMTKTVAAILLLWAFAAAQQVVPIPASEVRYRKEIFRNEHLTAFLLEIPPHHETLMHRRDRDILAVFLGGGQITSTYYGRSSVADTIPAGEVRFWSAGFA